MQGNAFDTAKVIMNEKVVCADVSGEKPKFLTSQNTWTADILSAHFSEKFNLFDKACELSNWNEIAGSCAFLNNSEILELARN